jgi:myosin heavy subunit
MDGFGAGMGWDFDALQKKKEENWWTSYSDLFMMLSVVFLLLYVNTALRNTSSAIKNFVDMKKMQIENQDLKEQTRVYSTLKERYLEKNASEDERKTYEKLMAKLDLLQEDAKAEKRKLMEQAQENEEKAEALNQYQQIIRNIINANVLAKAGIKKRDAKIEEKKVQLAQTEQTLQQRTSELSERNQQVEQLQSEVVNKSNEISNINNEIAKNQRELEQNIKLLREKESNNSQLNQMISNLKAQTATKVAALNAQNAQAEQELARTKSELGGLEQALGSAKSQLGSVQGELGQVKGELGQVKGELGKAAGELGKAKGMLGSLKNELESTKGQAKAIEGKLRNVEQEATKYKEYVHTLEREKSDLSRDLGRAKEALEAKRTLANRIKNALNKAGVDSQVDPKNGDVIINFGNEYFDTDKSNLKPGMITTLEKFFPAYAKSLLGSKDYSDQIHSVEIIGFSSPTYRGKFVDPQSLSEGDRTAVNYNLDLSYRRARSIFQHITNKQKFTFQYQQDLLPLLKVTGRSYLSDNVKGRDLKSGLNHEEFCAKYDCKKSQKVIIRFEVKN